MGKPEGDEETCERDQLREVDQEFDFYERVHVRGGFGLPRGPLARKSFVVLHAWSACWIFSRFKREHPFTGMLPLFLGCRWWWWWLLCCG